MATKTRVTRRPHMQSTSHALAMPLLRAVRNDGVVEDISEGDLYRYTRHRWVYNESRRLSERYLKFDLGQLLKAAVAGISSEGARYCVKVLKYKEGLNNKAYLLTMDNGAEVFARLPNPCAGPSFYTTASEVATRKFLHDVLDIPTPRTIAWSADRNNPVGAEYIIEEKAPAKPLGKLWQDWDEWPMKDRFTIIEQIVEIERKLTSTRFAKSGCIYFREDIPNSDALVTNPPLCSSILEREGSQEFVEAMAENETKFIQAHARPRMNYARSLTEPESPDEMLDLLDRYLQLAPAMVPQPSDDTHAPTLWHPDLHLDNVFVDPESKQITRVIDWQSAAVLPFFYQCGIPTMFKHQGPVSEDMTVWPKRPENYHNLEQDEKLMIDSLIGSECLNKYYLAITHNKNPRNWAGPTAARRRTNTTHTHCPEHLCPDAGPCPVSFNEQEMALYAHEEENRSYVSEILTLFRKNWRLLPDGSIESARFEEIQNELTQMREAFIGAADNEEDRLLAEKLWPYQDATDNCS
ncbi:kinase-like domain-containing protein [Leptodontidium sp. MPI-SDFR-AT-0119]|nr:kinase-like domain-containing protein [Leptodontidium sp. MPI-SDFR-AT-0119]